LFEHRGVADLQSSHSFILSLSVFRADSRTGRQTSPRHDDP
jgi:hypothetical protein